jgi:hypothetical protein
LKPKRGRELKKGAEIKGVKNIFAFSLHTPFMKNLVCGQE